MFARRSPHSRLGAPRGGCSLRGIRLADASAKDNMKKLVGSLLATVGAAGALRAIARRARNLDLRDRGVLITGASRGLGLQLAREFGRHGARLAICARDPDELKRASDDLTARGVSVVTVPCDVGNREQVDAMVAAVTRELGAVDVLVNNAGVIQVGPVATMTVDDFEAAMASNSWVPSTPRWRHLPRCAPSAAAASSTSPRSAAR